MTTPKYFLLTLGFLLASALSAQTTLLNETFGGTGGSLSNSGSGVSGWFLEAAAGGTATYSTGSPGSLVVNNGATGDGALTYFTPQALNVGDSLTVTLNFSVVNGGAGNSLRLAILNSQGSRATTNTSNSNAIYANYQGFAANFSPTNFSTENIYQRTGSNNQLLSSNGGIWTSIAATPLPSGGTLASSTPYVMVVTITRTGASTISIASQINSGGVAVAGYTNTATSTATGFTTTFDTFVLHALSNTVTSFTLTGVNIVYTPPPAATPAFNPVAGTYTAVQAVTLSNTDPSDSFVYTTDGSTPTESGGTPTGTGLLYAGPIAIGATTTLQAIAFKTGTFSDSAVASALYTINLPAAASPTFNPVAGTYTSAQSVIISTTTAGASFVYTTDGTTPTESGGTPTNGTLNTGAAISIPATTTLKAIAFESGFTDSAVTSGAYTINIPGQTAAPTFSPGAGTYTSIPQSITLASTTGGAAIRYTTDGVTTPTETVGTLYAGPVSITSTTTLQAIAYATGLTDSAVISRTYTITLLQVAAPTFSPAAGSFTAAQAISIASTTGGASIRYTTDGVTTPTETVGTLYTGPVSIGSTTTLKAIAFAAGMTDSAVSTALYTVVLPKQTSAPTFSPGAGPYTSPQVITIACATSGASIRYTTDGSTPTSTTGIIYTSPVPIGSTTTFQAIAFSPGNPDSTVSTAVYTVNIDYGGHGGGALDGWFLGALAMLGVLRWRRTRR